ncbi:hypothetical protein [Prauserella muralis]|uniref:Uncharacterized protein n=1 Tax=Prauserella muralis TaxID=588067 RepID=A0A2V4B8X1_9PSEU|nr:hypothetical protein [Prauserella muralis]PXY31865.1 hypothetical protein BAY60_05915 [Prauserella muralis]TWE13719.1 hypothetical protein FHX69_5847 [Prauserella muralis]
MTSGSPLRVVRDGIGARLARLVDFRIDERIREHVSRLARHADRLDEHGRRLDEQRKRLDSLQKNLETVRGDLLWTTSEVKRLIPHVAAQEAQLEDLRGKLALAPAADQAEVAEARSLIEEVQRQHAQIRVRLTGIARYEERLRRLEEQANSGAGK